MPHPDLRPDALPPVARRFLRYVRVHTTSDPDAPETPSTARQLDLARLLRDELAAMGWPAEIDVHGYVYATLPAVLPEGARAPRLGLVAHVDTSPDAPGEGVHPTLHPDYDGGMLALPGDPTVTLDPARQPALRAHVGHTLITSDGTTLLGSDDKAGVAVIMQLAEDLIESSAPRPELRLLFTVDEEIGRGVDRLDLARFGAHVAYTLDGSSVGQIENETFSAAEATVTVRGTVVHPGYAHGVLVNAARIAAEIAAALPADEMPETTRGREGYFYPHTLTGDTDRASLKVLLRDFEDDGMARRQETLERLVAEARERHPKADITLDVREQYRNMRDAIEAQEPRAVPFAMAAARAVGLEPSLHAIRGGTDGARLSALGVPTPNVFTGGHDFHSRFEWNSVENLETTLAFTHALVAHWAAHGTDAPPDDR